MLLWLSMLFGLLLDCSQGMVLYAQLELGTGVLGTWHMGLGGGGMLAVGGRWKLQQDAPVGPMWGGCRPA